MEFWVGPKVAHVPCGLRVWGSKCRWNSDFVRKSPVRLRRAAGRVRPFSRSDTVLCISNFRNENRIGLNYVAMIVFVRIVRLVAKTSERQACVQAMNTIVVDGSCATKFAFCATTRRRNRSRFREKKPRPAIRVCYVLLEKASNKQPGGLITPGSLSLSLSQPPPSPFSRSLSLSLSLARSLSSSRSLSLFLSRSLLPSVAWTGNEHHLLRRSPISTSDPMP